MLSDRRDYGILPGCEIEVPRFLRENFRSALTGSVKEVNNGPVYRFGARLGRLLTLSARVTQPCFCVQHTRPVARLNSQHKCQNELGNLRFHAAHGKI